MSEKELELLGIIQALLDDHRECRGCESSKLAFKIIAEYDRIELETSPPNTIR